MKAKKSTAKKTKNADRYNYQGIQLLVLTKGHDEVRKLLQTKKVTMDVARRALDSLRTAAPDKATLFEAMLTSEFASARAGKTPPQPGEERLYKAQKFRDSGLFGRIPLDLIVKNKGDYVSVTFNKDGSALIKPATKAQARKTA